MRQTVHPRTIHIPVVLTHGPRLTRGPYLLVVTYRDGVKHRNAYDTISELLADLALRIADHEQYGSVKHWKVIPTPEDEEES